MEIRIPMPADIKAAQRGMNMLSMSIADLQNEVDLHTGKTAFASLVIRMAALQMIAIKRRNGAEE